MTKRLIAFIAALALSTLGLVATAGTSQAADCPYPGCVKTDTGVKKPPKKVKKGAKPKVRVTVAANGNVKPKGQVIIRVKRIGNGPKYFRQIAVKYSGNHKYSLPKLNKPGKYRVVVIFKPGKNAPFKSSRDNFTLRVKR